MKYHYNPEGFSTEGASVSLNALPKKARCVYCKKIVKPQTHLCKQAELTQGGK